MACQDMTRLSPDERRQLDKRTHDQMLEDARWWRTQRAAGKLVKEIAFDEKCPEWRIYGDLAALKRHEGMPSTPPRPASLLDQPFVTMLHMIRDEIRAADRAAILREVEAKRLT